MRIIDFFDQGAELYPDNLAFVDGDDSLTYTQASEKSHHIASAIRGHGGIVTLTEGERTKPGPLNFMRPYSHFPMRRTHHSETV